MAEWQDGFAQGDIIWREGSGVKNVSYHVSVIKIHISLNVAAGTY